MSPNWDRGVQIAYESFHMKVSKGGDGKGWYEKA